MVLYEIQIIILINQSSYVLFHYWCTKCYEQDMRLAVVTIYFPSADYQETVKLGGQSSKKSSVSHLIDRVQICFPLSVCNTETEELIHIPLRPTTNVCK